MQVTITKKDEVHLRVQADPGIMLEMSDFFTFAVPGAQFTPQYRAKIWDGKLRLLNVFTKELYMGLAEYVRVFCERSGYEFHNDIPSPSNDKIEHLDAFIASLRPQSRGKDIEVRDYQRNAVLHALERNRALLLSPTASGKSLIIYILMRWHHAHNRRQLIIVPTTSLVEQMYGDFMDYAQATDFAQTLETSSSLIYSGTERKKDAFLTISTWQSIYKQPKSFFEQFDVIYGDEAHLFKSKSLTNILHKTTKTPFKIGTTGTLDGTKTHKLVLEGLFGPVHKVTTTKELMDQAHLAELKITCLQLAYSQQERALCKKFSYQEEMDWLVTHPRRNVFLKNLILDRKGNTLVLFQYVEKHGKHLYDILSSAAGKERKVYFVHGKIKAMDREDIRATMENEENAIIIASYGTFSTGINIRNLHNVVFASPSKSRIRNLQSIGRGLRLGDKKVACRLYDIGDDLSHKTHKNYTLLHLIERIRIYNEEGFEYKMVHVPFHEKENAN